MGLPGKAIAVVAGACHSLAVLESGECFAWGQNGDAQLGDGTETKRSTPVKVVLPGKAIAVVAGLCHSLAVLESGECFAWGLNSQGVLGDGTQTRRLAPVQVLLPSKVSCSKTFEEHPFRSIYHNTSHPQLGDQVYASVESFLLKLPEHELSVTPVDCQQMITKLRKSCRDRYQTEVRNVTAGANVSDALEPENVAGIMWTSDSTVHMHGSEREFCWLVNWCIRTGNISLLTALMPFCRALNRFSAPPRPEASLAQVPQVNTKPPWDKLINFQLFRGGGFNMSCKTSSLRVASSEFLAIGPLRRKNPSRKVLWPEHSTIDC